MSAMETKDSLETAVRLIGLQQLANGLGCSYQAIRKWQKLNRMPDSEFSGRTMHSKKIQELTGNKVTIFMLLGCVPPHLNKVA